MRQYACLQKNLFVHGPYAAVPLRDEDKFEILSWRNSQLDILRQKHPLTSKDQEDYFKKTIAPLFSQEKPTQILWSFLLNEKLIGYGGLVHIDWDALNGEISFLLCNERNKDVAIFKDDWKVFLDLISEIAFKELKFHKIYTYAYDIRKYYFDVMYELGFTKEAHYKEHVLVGKKLADVIVLSKFQDQWM